MLKPQSNGPLYSNTVIGTLAVAGCMGSYIWYSEEEPGRDTAPHSPLLTVPNRTFISLTYVRHEDTKNLLI